MRRVLETPAKINLGLRIVGRRADGYHLLDSLFVPIALWDRVELEVRAAEAITVELELVDPQGRLAHDNDPGRNLATRAALAFLEQGDRRAALRIRLEKRIPVGAGLGGGSSDAAAVLRLLADHFPGALSASALSALALSLGADVPFFLDPGPAWVAGIGEIIEPIESFPTLPLLVATPTPPLSTAEVFKAYAKGGGQKGASAGSALTPESHHRRIRPPLDALRSFLTGSPASSKLDDTPLRNDLETVAVALHPGIRRLRERMVALGAHAVGMSGSGPTVFGVFADVRRARKAREESDWDDESQVFFCESLA